MRLAIEGLGQHTRLFWIASRAWRGFKTGGDEDEQVGRVIGLLDTLRELAGWASRKKCYRLESRSTQLLDLVIAGRKYKLAAQRRSASITDLKLFRIHKERRDALRMKVHIMQAVAQPQQSHKHFAQN